MEAVEEVGPGVGEQEGTKKEEEGEKVYDFVVFGATGFTGQYVVEEMAKVIGDKYRWAIAGRNLEKLRKILEEVQNKTGLVLEGKVGVADADIENPASLESLAKKTIVLLNCVGPYQKYGKIVVEKCIENGCNYVDISGEPLYLEETQLNYNDAAEKNGVYVVGACGWDSIPFEMGIAFLRKHFLGDLNSIEGFVKFQTAKGYSIHYGTFESMIDGFAKANEVKSIRKKLMPDRLPTGSFKSPARGYLFKESINGDWCLPFLGSDKSVANRTQYFNYHHNNVRPLNIQTYIGMPSLFWAVCMILWGVLFGLMASLTFARDLLKKYPEIFSFGMFTKKGPSREQVEGSSFTYWLLGRGWSTKAATVEEQHDEAPSEQIICRVDGPEMAYVATSSCLVASALTILEEKKRMPKEGGVFPPGAAFQNTAMIDRLEERNIKFAVVDSSVPAREE